MTAARTSHDPNKMLFVRPRDGRKPKPPSEGHIEQAAAQHEVRLAAEVEAMRERIPVTPFIAGKRAEVDRLEALARSLLEAHPAPKIAPVPGSIDDQVEAEWRELAHAGRQLRPLLTALEQANARESGFEKWKEGFDFRLTEAMVTVGTLCSFLRLQPLRQRKTARNPRPKAESPFTRFIKARPRATPTEIKGELEDDARNGVSGDLVLSDDGLRIIAIEDPARDPPRHLKISDIRQAVAKARRRRPEKSTAQK